MRIQFLKDFRATSKYDLDQRLIVHHPDQQYIAAGQYNNVPKAVAAAHPFPAKLSWIAADNEKITVCRTHDKNNKKMAMFFLVRCLLLVCDCDLVCFHVSFKSRS